VTKARINSFINVPDCKSVRIYGLQTEYLEVIRRRTEFLRQRQMANNSLISYRGVKTQIFCFSYRTVQYKVHGSSLYWDTMLMLAMLLVNDDQRIIWM